MKPALFRDHLGTTASVAVITFHRRRYPSIADDPQAKPLYHHPLSPLIAVHDPWLTVSLISLPRRGSRVQIPFPAPFYIYAITVNGI